MLDISSREVRDLDLFVAFFDLTGFTAFARQHDSRTVFDTLSGWYALVGRHVEGAGGHVVKFMGDAGIAVFAADDTEAGVAALRNVQAEGDAMLAARGFKAHAVMRGHVGPVTCGPLGPPGWQQFDVIGETVNTAAVASASGHYRFALTPQAFRRLSAAGLSPPVGRRAPGLQEAHAAGCLYSGRDPALEASPPLPNLTGRRRQMPLSPNRHADVIEQSH